MRYKLLGDTGLRVSELALGTMTFGEDWGWGAPKKACKEIFETYVDAGGNFLDTAVNYTNGTSEEIVGDLIEGDRDRFVVATKYTLSTRPGDPNAGGSHRKNLFASLEKSLDRLGTDHVDLLWVHAWDRLTPIEETMRGLEDLVAMGKVHHVGFSDAPAWVVSRAHQLAQERDWVSPAAIQVRYNLIDRTIERDLLPMAEHLGLGVTVWGPLGQGVLTGKYLDEGTSRGRRDDVDWEVTEAENAVAREVVDVAEDLGVSAAQVAIAWVRQQSEAIVPIIGARTPGQLDENLASLEVEVTGEHLALLDEATAIERGFPYDFLEGDEVEEILYGGTLASIDHHRG